MSEQLTKNAVADIKTEFELEREKIQIERARIELERERLAAERERWQSEAEWRTRASGQMIPVSTLVYVSVICLLVAGVGGWLGGNFVARREAERDNTNLIQALTTSAGESTNSVSPVVIRRPRGGNILLLVE